MEIELGRIFRAVKRFWWVMLAFAAAGGLLTGLIGALLPKTYTAETSLLVLPNSLSGVALTGEGDPVTTYLQMFTSQSVLTQVIDENDLEETPEELVQDIVVSRIPSTNLILVQVSSDDPQKSSDLANSISDRSIVRINAVSLSVLQTQRDDFVYQRDQLDTQIDTVDEQIDQLAEADGELSTEDQEQLESLQEQRLNMQQRRVDLESRIRSINDSISAAQAPVIVNEPANPPIESDNISTILIVAVGIVLGGLIGIGVMLWLELRDPRIRDVKHLAEITGNELPMRVSRNVESADAKSSLKLAATRIQGYSQHAGNEVILLVSARKSETLATVAGALQNAMAQGASEIVLVPALLDTGLVDARTGAKANAFILTEEGETSAKDVVETVVALRDMGVHSAGVVLVS